MHKRGLETERWVRSQAPSSPALSAWSQVASLAIRPDRQLRRAGALGGTGIIAERIIAHEFIQTRGRVLVVRFNQFERIW